MDRRSLAAWIVPVIVLAAFVYNDTLPLGGSLTIVADIGSGQDTTGPLRVSGSGSLGPRVKLGIDGYRNLHSGSGFLVLDLPQLRVRREGVVTLRVRYRFLPEICGEFAVEAEGWDGWIPASLEQASGCGETGWVSGAVSWDLGDLRVRDSLIQFALVFGDPYDVNDDEVAFVSVDTVSMELSFPPVVS